MNGYEESVMPDQRYLKEASDFLMVQFEEVDPSFAEVLASLLERVAQEVREECAKIAEVRGFPNTAMR